MTAKRFTLNEYLPNEYGLRDNGEEIAYVSHKSAFTIVDLLNDYHKKDQFNRRHILCLQSTIQDIDIEIRVNGSISKERFEQIKDKWATKMLNEEI